MTETEYATLLATQEGKCAICETTTPTGKWKVFAVDHCHTTNTVRGILCNECNRGIGLLGDNEERLEKASRYIQDHKKKTARERKKMDKH